MHGNDLVIVNPDVPEMILEYREQKIALTASPDAGDDFHKAVMHDGLDFIEIVIAFDFHVARFLFL